MARTHRAFTLVELLVVIAILGVLMGLAIVGVNSALQSGKVSATHTLIQSLKASIEGFSTQNGLPPASLSAVDPSFQDDGMNSGIECVLMLLRATNVEGGPYFAVNDFADHIKNTDDEGIDASIVYEYFAIQGSKLEFLDVVDSWGNPLAYIPREAYGQTFMIMDANGDLQQIEAVDHNGLGLTQPFLLWSFGPNGQNENGGGDDITSWQVAEEDD